MTDAKSVAKIIVFIVRRTTQTNDTNSVTELLSMPSAFMLIIDLLNNRKKKRILIDYSYRYYYFYTQYLNTVN